MVRENVEKTLDNFKSRNIRRRHLKLRRNKRLTDGHGPLLLPLLTGRGGKVCRRGGDGGGGGPPFPRPFLRPPRVAFAAFLRAGSGCHRRDPLLQTRQGDLQLVESGFLPFGLQLPQPPLHLGLFGREEGTLGFLLL